jgi:Flp pilus assembly protein TadG
MALILPVLLILFLGLVDLSALLSDSRRVTYSTNVVADLVTRLNSPTTPDAIDDAFRGAELVLSSRPAGDTRIEVYNFHLVNDVRTRRWSRSTAGTLNCAAPDESNLNDLIRGVNANDATDDNDIIVVVTCRVHAPIVTNIIGWRILGRTTFQLQRQIAMKPRESLRLECPGC